jgi:hypothetical protein
MIYYPKAQPVTVEHLPIRITSGGLLMKLPIELLHATFSFLDFENLRALRLVSYEVKEAVDEMPAYRLVVRHASAALRALQETRLISQFSAADLYQVMNTDRCAVCCDYGPFLFLPTIERTCANCLDRSLFMRVISISDARRCYTLT